MFPVPGEIGNLWYFPWFRRVSPMIHLLARCWKQHGLPPLNIVERGLEKHVDLRINLLPSAEMIIIKLGEKFPCKWDFHKWGYPLVIIHF